MPTGYKAGGGILLALSAAVLRAGAAKGREAGRPSLVFTPRGVAVRSTVAFGAQHVSR